MTANDLTQNSHSSCDDARKFLCTYLAQTIRGGSVRMRIRLHQPLGAAWFYEHHHNTWHKQDVVLENLALVQMVLQELALLASKPHGDLLQVTRHTGTDWQETEFQFPKAEIERHLDDNLETYLDGLLFRDRHDSRQDARRRVRPSSPHNNR